MDGNYSALQFGNGDSMSHLSDSTDEELDNDSSYRRRLSTNVVGSHKTGGSQAAAAAAGVSLSVSSSSSSSTTANGGGAASPPALALNSHRRQASRASVSFADAPLLAALRPMAPAEASPRLKAAAAVPPPVANGKMKPIHTTMDTPLRHQYTGLAELKLVDTDWAKSSIVFKICLIGDADVGKTSLFLNFSSSCNGTGLLQHVATPGADMKNLHIPLVESTRTEVLLQIWDTAGQERFKAITLSYLRMADLVILVYDVTNPITLENIGIYWWEEVRKHTKGKCKYVLVGNKMDAYKATAPPLASVDGTPPPLMLPLDARKVADQRELERVLKIELDPGSNFFYVSAKDGHNVAELLLSCKRILYDGCDQIEKAIAAGRAGVVHGSPAYQANTPNASRRAPPLLVHPQAAIAAQQRSDSCSC